MRKQLNLYKSTRVNEYIGFESNRAKRNTLRKMDLLNIRTETLS